MMKKAAFVFLLCLGLLLCVAALAENAGRTALDVIPEMGLGVNLGNTFEACDANKGNVGADPSHYETLWGQPVTTQDMIHGLREAGFSTLRVPAAWMTNASHLDKGDYTLDQAYLARVAEVVSWALDEGMYVILNDHWDGGWYGMFGSESPQTRAFAMEAYRGMWKQIAEYFADFGDRLIFEGANEEIGARFDENSALFCSDSVVSYYSDNEKYALANQVNQAFVDTVRAAGGNNAQRFLLIPGYGTNIDQTCDDRFVMPTDTAQGKLFISVHYYDPWSYCGATSSKGATLWGTKSDLAYMAETLAKMDKFTKAGYGVIIGEYGALPGDDGSAKENSVFYHEAFLNQCAAHNLVSVLWDPSVYYIRRELSFAEPEMGALYARFAAVPKTAEQALADFDVLSASAPDTFNADAIQITDEKAVAWLMWNDGGWAISYSVGDTYNPDSITPGLRATDVEITGEGTYTVGLDFTGTEQGYSASVAFSALGIANGEALFPGYCVHITECVINGEPYTFRGRPYTTSDDGLCTRVNLFNEWVTKIDTSKARVLYGPLVGISATPIDRSDAPIARIESIYVTFVYAPRAN